MNGSNVPNIAYIAPYTLPSSNNSKLISLLSNPKKLLSTEQEPSNESLPLNFVIPTTSQFDASSIVELNNTRILSQSSEQSINNQQTSSTSAETVDENDDPKLLIEIDTIKPTNLQQQLSTIVLNNFPNLKNNVVEQVLTSMINLSVDKSTDLHRSFHWSQINFEFTDSKVILIKFDKVEDSKWFIETYNRIDTLLPKVEMIYSHLVQDRLAEVPSHPSTTPESLKTKLKLILCSSKNYAKPKLSGLEELDQVMKSYSDYKVDYNDLVDVPNEMKDGIIKDIFKFRSKMLLIEKENRQKQIEQERLETKSKLNKLFRGIERTEEEKKVQERQQSSNEGVAKEEVVVIPDQYEHLNDEEYTKMIREKETEKHNQEYQTRLTNFAKRTSEKSKLESMLEKLHNYEVNLIDNKSSSIDKLRNYEKLDITTMYTYRYNDYLKQRNAKRSLENKLDDEDAAAEEKEHEEEVASIEPDIPPVKKQKVQTNTKSRLDLPDVESMSEEVKSSIHEKISNLVEEYLGVQDEFLIDVIKQHIEASGFKGKAALVQDIFEVLDEDAENLVNDLYQYVESIAST
ncbi:SNU71 [Candida theae]|uniref:U1 small nuclear ribonucleoprotein component SNU71 n=1 Tax=Candida theae TaxID=1198502 RepID=A0AAD5BGA9_9ASCO|nr:SNU71 [Candida theae]KAI5959542.1 SNU71 [Candida theae]